jgi:endonuclease/exonuclease/phosphatase family metal-dependent hydrolase
MTQQKTQSPTGVRRLRVATYNIHKCRGMDGRVRPDRIARVLREMDADILALQEVVSLAGRSPEQDQARYLAEELGFYAHLGENRRLGRAAYGNLLLSRFPIHATQNYDITARRGRERRGCLRVDLKAGEGALLHVFNIHMGTGFFERRHQVRKLVDARVLDNGELSGPRIVLGDFNEWTRGMASRFLCSRFPSADPRSRLRRTRSYPGVLPFLHLDHVYFDSHLELERLTLHRSLTALLASDHLPILADFRLGTSGAQRAA